MAIVVNGSGTITGISTGGLPDGSVDVDTLAANSVTAAKIVDGTIVDAEVTSLAASKLTGALPAISAASLTNIPAANITGTLPAISGANLTGVAVAGISSSADATAIEIDSSENVGIDHSSGFGNYSGTGVKYAKGDGTLFVGRDGGQAFIVNRETNQGDMICLNVAGSSKVKIGTVNGVLRQAGVSAQEFAKAL